MAAKGFLFGDTFDYYATANIFEKWTNTSSSGATRATTITNTAARNGVAGMKINLGNFFNDVNSTDVVRKTLAPGDPTTFVFRTAFLYTAGQSVYTMPFVGCYDNATCQTNLALQANGKLVAIRGTSISNIIAGALSTTALLANVWYHIKFKVVVHPSAGSVACWINGLPAFNVTGVNTRNSANSSWDTLGIGKPACTGQGLNVIDGGNYYFDDLNVRDDDDGRYDLIGIALHAQAGNGTHTDFTPSTGSDHGNMVADVIEDGDTTFNQATAVNQVDTYNMENLPVAATVAFVQTVEVVRKTDAGDRTCANVLRIGGADYVGADYAPSQVYSHCLTPYNVSPATGVAFTDTEVNAMESGQKVTS